MDPETEERESGRRFAPPIHMVAPPPAAVDAMGTRGRHSPTCGMLLVVCLAVCVVALWTTDLGVWQTGDSGGVVPNDDDDAAAMMASKPSASPQGRPAAAAISDIGVPHELVRFASGSDGCPSPQQRRPHSLFPTFLPNITEIAPEDPATDGPLYNESLSGFVSGLEWRGKCWYEVTNFCVVRGQLTFFHAPESGGPRKGSLRMCNEFSQHSDLIRLRYTSLPAHANESLPGPLLTRTPGWVLQFWCQDLFHMTLGLMPAYLTVPNVKRVFESWYKKWRGSAISGGGGDPPLSIGEKQSPHDETKTSCRGDRKAQLATSPPGSAVEEEGVPTFHPDVYMRIAKGKRKKSAYCRIKFGHPQSFKVVRNERWGDHQFPFPGNPYWPFYESISPDPFRFHPLYSGATQKTACYKVGVIDKLYVKEVTGDQARRYSGELKRIMGVQEEADQVRPRQSPDASDVGSAAVGSATADNATASQVGAVVRWREGFAAIHHGAGRRRRGARRCNAFRATIIDRRGKTRRLTNVPRLVEAAARLGFEAQAVALETLPIKEQIRLMTHTDVLVGVHGNGITWLQFLQPGSVVVELVGIWYQPYAKLWGHRHLHSSMRNNMEYKTHGEYVPFAHNITEFEELMAAARRHLDHTTGCLDAQATPFVPPNEKLDNLYKDCVPHC